MNMSAMSRIGGNKDRGELRLRGKNPTPPQRLLLAETENGYEAKLQADQEPKDRGGGEDWIMRRKPEEVD